MLERKPCQESWGGSASDSAPRDSVRPSEPQFLICKARPDWMAFLRAFLSLTSCLKRVLGEVREDRHEGPSQNPVSLFFCHFRTRK